MTEIPNRPPDREAAFSLEEAPPDPVAFVAILEAAGFVFDTTDDPISLKPPKRMFVDGTVVRYQQWDHYDQ